MMGAGMPRVAVWARAGSSAAGAQTAGQEVAPIDRPAHSSRPASCRIMEVDVATHRALVLQKVLPADEPSRLCAEMRLPALGPGFLELDAVNRHRNINPHGRLANLVKEAFVGKIIRA